MKFIVISAMTRDVTDLLDAEASRVADFVREGVFVQVWPKADMSGAEVLAHAPDQAALRHAVATLPTVTAGAASNEFVAVADAAG